MTITGTNFYGLPVTVSGGCTGLITQYPSSFNQITCTLAAGAAGTDTGNIVVTTNGGATAATGYIVYYGECKLQ